MAISFQTLKFIKYCYSKHGSFKKTLVIGKQELALSTNEVNKIISPSKTRLKRGEYWDELLIKYFGSTQVVNLDCSKYENAELIVNLNLVYDNKMNIFFDTIIQLGSLEHCINPLQGILNLNKLAGKNCIFIHQVPANNYIDHGFYQFSPDFFKVLYPKKIFTDQKILLCSIKNKNTFFEDKFNEKNFEGYKYFNSKYPVDIFFKCKKKKTINLNIKKIEQPKYSSYYKVSYKKNKENISNKLFTKIKKKLFNLKYYDEIQRIYAFIFGKKKFKFKYFNINK